MVVKGRHTVTEFFECGVYRQQGQRAASICGGVAEADNTTQ